MKKSTRVLIFTCLAVVFVATVGFAVREHARAQHAERLLSNTYYHAFTELTTAAGELDSALQKVTYTTPGPLQDSLYQQIYAKALAAQYALGELPYASMELEQTAAFFAKTGDYAMSLTRGGTSDAREQLAALSRIAEDLSVSLNQLQGELEAGALDLNRVTQATRRLSDSEAKSEMDGGVTFQTVESDFPELPSLVYDGPFSEHMSAAVPKALEGLSDVTPEEARERAAAFLNVSPGALTLASAGNGVLPTYSFTLPQDGGTGYIEITRQGGQVLSYFQDRCPGQPSLSVEEAVSIAQNYLTAWAFPHMEPSYHIQREGLLTIHFAPVEQEIYCYPDLVKLTIALDNGKLLGYEAHGYLYQHRIRSFPAPAVSQDTARAAVPGGVEVLSAQKALIPTQGGTEEVLTYEFKCQTAEGRHVLIYVNAETGLQQNILLLLEDESGTLAL